MSTKNPHKINRISLPAFAEIAGKPVSTVREWARKYPQLDARRVAGRITVDPVAATLFLSGEPLCSARDAA